MSRDSRLATPPAVYGAIAFSWVHAALGVGIALQRPPLVGLILLMAVGQTLLALGLMRREQWAWWGSVGWAGLTLLVSLVQGRLYLSTGLVVLGLPLLRSSREWFGIALAPAVPATRTCPHCRAKVEVDRTSCPVCRLPFEE